jgi:AmmeMemoRadiSam system protein B
MRDIRQAAVAGYFYPEDPSRLRETVTAFLEVARPRHDEGAPVRAVVSPHAGYLYSGAVMAAAMAPLVPLRSVISRVVIVGPAHHVSCPRPALPSARAFRTPLGTLPVDARGASCVLDIGDGEVSEAAHGPEHAIEVLLPFVQVTLGDVSIVPVLASDVPPDILGGALDALWDEATLVIVSSDLSHHLPDAEARICDEETARRIEALAYERIGPMRACGYSAIGGLLHATRRRGRLARTVALGSSNDAVPGGASVVGYGAFEVT